jgi:hypothetical protein
MAYSHTGKDLPAKDKSAFLDCTHTLCVTFLILLGENVGNSEVGV